MPFSCQTILKPNTSETHQIWVDVSACGLVGKIPTLACRNAGFLAAGILAQYFGIRLLPRSFCDCALNSRVFAFRRRNHAGNGGLVDAHRRSSYSISYKQLQDRKDCQFRFCAESALVLAMSKPNVIPYIHTYELLGDLL